MSRQGLLRGAASAPAASALALPRLSLVLFGLMLTLPFLQPHHRLPVPSFYPEWWAALCGLLGALVAVAANPGTLRLPRVALLPLALVFLLFVQLLIRRPAATDPTLIALVMLSWAVLLMLGTRALQAALTPATVVNALALALLAGALAALASGLAQLVLPRGLPGLLAPTAPWRMTGNLAQANHLASYLWFGLAAAITLNGAGRLPGIATAAIVVLLAAGSTLTGSRSVWLYALLLVALAAFVRPRADRRPVLAWTLLALASVLAAEILIRLFLPELFANTASSRLVSEIAGGSIRLGLWRQAFELALAQPWSGVGWGHFPTAGYEQIANLRAGASAGFVYVPGEHAHNLFLQLWAELGIVAVAAAVLLLLGLGMRVGRRMRSPQHLLPLALAAILLLHSQVEYPLWYAFFLGPMAIALTLADPADLGQVELRRPQLALAGIALAGALVLATWRIDYGELEAATNWRVTRAGTQASGWIETRDTLLELRRHSVFSGYVDLALASALTVDRDRLADKIQVCEQAIRFSPVEDVVSKHALLLAMAGRGDEAKRRLQLALGAYPELAAVTAAQIGELKAREPQLAELEPIAQAAKQALSAASAR